MDEFSHDCDDDLFSFFTIFLRRPPNSFKRGLKTRAIQSYSDSFTAYYPAFSELCDSLGKDI